MSQYISTMRKTQVRGFTLIELLIVVAIVGIMASLMIPRMTSQVEKSRSAEAKVTLGMIQRRQNDYFSANGAYLPVPVQDANAFRTLGMDVPDSQFYTYGCVTPPACTATRNGTSAGGGVMGSVVTMDVQTRTLTCAGVYSQTGSGGAACV